MATTKSSWVKLGKLSFNYMNFLFSVCFLDVVDNFQQIELCARVMMLRLLAMDHR
jgi:hypothetical protein